MGKMKKLFKKNKKEKTSKKNKNVSNALNQEFDNNSYQNDFVGNNSSNNSFNSNFSNDLQTFENQPSFNPTFNPQQLNNIQDSSSLNVGKKISRRYFDPELFNTSKNEHFNPYAQSNKKDFEKEIDALIEESSIIEREKYPFEIEYSKMNNPVVVKETDSKANKLKKDVDQKSIEDFINSENKTTSIFSADKLYTEDELRIYKIPMSQTIKVFEKGLVYFKISNSKKMTAKEANILTFKNPYDIDSKFDVAKKLEELIEEENKKRATLNEVSKVNNNQNYNNGNYQNDYNYFDSGYQNNYQPVEDMNTSVNNYIDTYKQKPIYRVLDIFYEGVNSHLENISFDLLDQEIVAILSNDNNSNLILENILKGIERNNYGSIYFNNNSLNDSNKEEWVNLKDINLSDDLQVVNQNLINDISSINYLSTCLDDKNLKANAAFKKICKFFDITFNQYLLTSLVNLSKFNEFEKTNIKELDENNLGKFIAIADILINKKAVFIDKLVYGLNEQEILNLVFFLQDYITRAKISCLLVTNDARLASQIANRFIVISSNGVVADFNRWNVSDSNESLETYILDVITNSHNDSF